MKKIKYISITGPLVFDLGDSSVVNDIEKVTISNVVFPYQSRSIFWLRFLSNDKLIFTCDGNLSGYHFSMNHQDITNQLNAGNPAFNGGDVEITTQYFKYNGNTLCTFDKVFGNTSSHFFLFAMNGNADDYMLSGSCGTIRIYAGGEVVAEYIPVLDDNNVPCMYDNIQHTYIYKSGSGTVTPGPTLFGPSKSSFSFNSTGGSESFTIEAETGWTATTASDWVSLDNMTGTTGGTLVLTCNPNASDSARTATITFTDADANTFDITINQKKRGIWIPKAKVRKGALIVSKEYWNETNPEPQPNDEIWYTSSDSQVISPSGNFGANIVSNTYNEGKGIIKFDGNVTLIPDMAFHSKSNLISISLPSSVTSIGYSSFNSCGITGITIPNSVAIIGYVSFCSCNSLSRIEIPNSVIYIGEGAFLSCKYLEEVICYPNTPPELDGTLVFTDQKEGRKIKVPSGSVDAYKAATNWSEYANDIISQ